MEKVILLSLSILLISLAYSFAEVPCKINYQGRLIKDNVPVDGTKTMKFSIYDSAVGPALLWTSGDVDITVYNGLFRYVIGSDGGDLSSIDWTAGETLYLEVQVETDVLTPREELYAYPYAINSRFLEGKTTDYFLNASGEEQTKDGGLNIMGNVGIGTTDPQGYKLYVAGDILSSTGKFYNVDKNDYIEIRASDESIRFFTQDAEKLTVLNSGNVGIGTTSPQARLHIGGTPGTDGIMFPDGTLQTSAGRGFGDWVEVGLNILGGTVYGPVATDGFVTAHAWDGHLQGYTDSSSNPGRMVIRHNLYHSGSGSGIMFPVKKGDYWKVNTQGGDGRIDGLYWIPFGN